MCKPRTWRSVLAEPRQPGSIREVVEHGLCIGCGLCQALAPTRWQMAMTPEGRLRPAELAPGDDRDILAACPGAICRAEEPAPGAKHDAVWGSYLSMSEAWAGDDAVRFRGATGGVLTALGMYLLSSGKAQFILHVGPDPAKPMRSMWVMSETPGQVLDNCGSRYGPTDPLAGLETALARNEPFAVICKPCDAGAIRARAKADPRIDALVVAVLVLFCGGASELGKSEDLLQEFGVSEEEVSLFRYRGHGNPGPTRVETRDGRGFETSYHDLWADEGSWRIQTRCKLCPDAIGEAADVAALDIWPGGSPVGEDAGFNGIVVRSRRGSDLVRDAVAAGALVLGRAHDPRDLDDFQPHQVAKKRAMAARLRGMTEAGAPVYAHQGLRIDELDGGDAEEQAGAALRMRNGRFREEMPKGG